MKTSYLIYGEDARRLAKRDNLKLYKENEEFGYYQETKDIGEDDSVCVLVKPAGWVAPEGFDLTGYYFSDYFDRSGNYKGQDEFGVEPRFENHN